MRFFAKHHRADDHWPDRPQDPLPPPDLRPAVAAGAPRPRLIKRSEPHRTSSGLAGWLLALGVGAAIAVVAVIAMQDPRSVGTQLDDAVASVRNLGSEAERSVADSQNAAVQASRNVVDGVSTAIDDTGISAKVKAALAVDPALSASRIDVQTDNGVVRLSGPAPDAAAKERATVLAAAPQGVRAVDNRLTLPQPAANVVAVAGAASQPAQ
jgi:osmotically-inducible protein OsmY